MATAHLPRRLACVLGQASIGARPSSFLAPNGSPLGRPLSSLTSLVGASLRVPLQTPPRRTYASPPAATAADETKKRVVFLGTPDVAALVLRKLAAAAAAPDSTFELAAVVSQPGRPRGRSRQAQPSPVEAAAAALGLPPHAILCPERAGDPAFLAALQALAPDLAVTAAYGNYLPSSFLGLPRFGTLNIHPSLLPAYRGAAPVQRSLQDGLALTGVTVLYTVKAMDAGPILAQQKVQVGPEEQTPELLARLFDLGTDLVLANLEAVWAGLAPAAARPQDEGRATHAPKISREEGELDFGAPAAACHNKVRAFAPWPGTYHTFELSDGAAGVPEPLELKILRTRVGEGGGGGPTGREVAAGGGGMALRCGDGGLLELLEVQAPGRKAVAAKDFVNGLKGRTLRWTAKAAG